MLHTTAKHRWRGLLRSTLGLWLQSPCPLCHRATTIHPCAACRDRVETERLPTAQQIQIQHGLVLFSWGHYQGASRQLMRAVKYEQQSDLAVLVGQYLGKAWDETLRSGRLEIGSRLPVVLPIPLHAEKLRQRGFNQAERIADGFCQMTRSPLCAEGLSRTENTIPQFGLSMIQRQQNVSGVFKVNPALRRHRDRPVLIVDDIYTTGATTHSAAKTLQREGYTVLGVAAVLRARSALLKPRRTPAI
mgnify:CR=1 FL=1